jgi:D-aminopeptidase
MADTTYWETLKLEGKTIVERVRELIYEGNVRRIVIQHEGRTVAEFPLTAGVIGAVVAPVLAAVGALVALLKDCTIQVEREEPTAMRKDSATAAGAPHD